MYSRPITLVNFDDCPADAIEALIWMSGVKERVDEELDARLQRAYYQARLTGRFEAALDLGFHSRKKALAYTRAENERLGRTLKWNDGWRA